MFSFSSSFILASWWPSSFRPVNRRVNIIITSVIYHGILILTDVRLHGVGSVQAVRAVGPHHARLLLGDRVPRAVEEVQLLRVPRNLPGEEVE